MPVLFMAGLRAGCECAVMTVMATKMPTSDAGEGKAASTASSA